MPGRRVFQTQLNAALKGSLARDSKGALMFIQLDGFRLVTEIFGDASASQLVRAAAERVARCVRPGDTVAHMGENEFTVVLPEVSEAADATRIAEKILNALVEPFQLGGQESYVAASLGVAVFPRDGGDYQTLLKNADAAMYSAKGEVGSSYKVYTPEMRRTVARKPALDKGLRRAIENREFVLEYEPQVDVATGRVVGAEALIRWRHPERGLLAPLSFMPLAEATGQIVDIGAWVLEQACRDAQSWAPGPNGPLTVGVNVSALQLNRPDLVDVVTGALVTSGLAASRLSLEITETAVTRATGLILETLLALHGQGIVIILDDFGTGFSSLSHLKYLPVDVVKVDQIFVAGVVRDPADAAITNAIITLAHGLGQEVIAEGVEHKDQFDFVRTHLCDRVQGHYFSVALTSERFEAFANSAQFG